MLSLHFGCLLLFLFAKWTGKEAPSPSPYISRLFKEVRLWPMTFEKRELNPYNTFLIIASSNFIGLAFSRGTHQQFYAWYSFSFPFLVDACSRTFGPLAQFAIVLTLDLAWSTGKPHNAAQGHCLNVAHALVLWGLLRQPAVKTY